MTSADSIVSPGEISVVIQGPLNLEGEPNIHDCIGSIRRHLPAAEIVVSTWQSEPDVSLSGVTMVRNEMVPPMIDVDGQPINTRRQRLSTLHGLQAASRPFVLKFRADHILLDPRITRLQRFDEGALERFRLFTAPVTTTTMFFRNPCAVPMLFHPSDLVQFGRREDLLAFWSAPPITLGEYFQSRPRANPLGNCIRFTARRYVPEQELMIAFLRTRGYDVGLPGICHLSPKLMRLSESVLLTNFRALDWQDAGIEFPARMRRRVIRQSADYSTASIAQAKQLLGGRQYVLRCAKALVNKYIFLMFSKRWWRRTSGLILLRWPPNLVRRRARNFTRYGLEPSDLTPHNTPEWRRDLWPSNTNRDG